MNTPYTVAGITNDLIAIQRTISILQNFQKEVPQVLLTQMSETQQMLDDKIAAEKAASEAFAARNEESADYE